MTPAPAALYPLLAESLTSRAPIRDLLVGASWTLVLGPALGASATPPPPPYPEPAPAVRGAGSLRGRPLRDLAPWIAEGNPRERALALAALGAQGIPAGAPLRKGRLQDWLLEAGRGKRVVVVGHFPFLERWRPAFADLQVLEFRPAPGDLPAAAAPQVLPRAQVVAITGSALANGTLPGLLNHVAPEAQVALFGPSVPPCPALFQVGIQVLGGSRFSDPEGAFRRIQEGGRLREAGAEPWLWFR